MLGLMDKLVFIIEKTFKEHKWLIGACSNGVEDEVEETGRWTLDASDKVRARQDWTWYGPYVNVGTAQKEGSPVSSFILRKQ